VKIRLLSILLLSFIFFAGLLFPAKVVIADDSEPTIGIAVQSIEPEASLQFVGCNPVYLTAINPAYEQQVVEMVNIEREKVGLPPLKRIESLDQAARFHAKDMAADAYFNHDSYDRTQSGLVFACSWSNRISRFYSNYGWLGENIAAGFGTPDSVMSAWMDSDGHRSNILSQNFTEYGVGYASGGPYGSYWVQDFGSRSNSYPLVIDREAAATDTPQVSLYLYGEGVWGEMRLRSDDNTWTEWQTFAKNVELTLDWTQGLHTVSVEFRKIGQTSAAASSSDTIELTTSGFALGNLPNQIVFIYDREAHQMYPQAYQLNPQNTQSDLTMSWQVSSTDAWIHISSMSGTTPAGTTLIQPDLQALKNTNELQGSVTMTVSGDLQAVGSPKTISVKMVVVDSLDNKLYLPSIRN